MSTHGLPGPAAGRSISDAKIGKVTGEAAPARVDAIDACRAGSFLRPTIELADSDLFSLCHDLDRPVGTILHPTSQTESSSFTLRRRAKVDALNATTHHQLKLLQGHFFLPAARTRVRSPPSFAQCSRESLGLALGYRPIVDVLPPCPYISGTLPDIPEIRQSGSASQSRAFGRVYGSGPGIVVRSRCEHGERNHPKRPRRVVPGSD